MNGFQARSTVLALSWVVGSEWNRALTDSPVLIRRIASASAGAMDNTVSFDTRFSAAMGTVSVQTISRTSGSAARRRVVEPEKIPCVQAIRMERALWSRKCRSSSRMDPPLTICLGEHNDVATADITDQQRNPDLCVAQPVLRARRHRNPQPLGEGRGTLGISQVGRHHDSVGQIVALEMLCELAERMQVIDRDAEKPVNLRGMERHRENSIGSRGRQDGQRLVAATD